MKVYGTWEFNGVQIVGHWYDDSTSPDKKRFVATKYGWSVLRREKCEAANRNCALQLPGCRGDVPLDRGDLHHIGKHGRGLGGAYRDDRDTEWACRQCHRKDHEQKRRGNA